MTSTPYLGHNAEQFLPSPASAPFSPYQDYQEPTRDYDDLNKSDSEKVLAKKIGGSVNFRTDDLDILYNARGKEIDKLQKQLAEEREEHEKQLRSCRHQLALSRSESHNNAGDLDQMNKVVNDARRENKVLTGEIHNMNFEVKRLRDENEALLMEKESSGNIIQQLQIQLSQLQSSDAVLKARTQHDATVRSLLERHKEEMAGLRAELDRANTRLAMVEQENSNMSHKLGSALQEKEAAVRAKVEAVTELSAKLTESLRSNNREEESRLRLELRREKEERERDAYIQHLEDEVNDFASARPSYDLSPLRCCAHLLQLPIMKTLKDKDLVFYDLLDKVRKMVINFCKSVNAKGDLYEHVQLHMVSYVVICWLSDVDMMEWLVSTRRTTGSSTKSSPSQVWVGR